MHLAPKAISHARQPRGPEGDPAGLERRAIATSNSSWLLEKDHALLLIFQCYHRSTLAMLSLVAIVELVLITLTLATMLHAPLNFNDVGVEAFLVQERNANRRSFDEVAEQCKLRCDSQILITGDVHHHVELWVG